MEIDAADVINRLSNELTQTIQRAIIAEARAEAAENKLKEDEENGS